MCSKIIVRKMSMVPSLRILRNSKAIATASSVVLVCLWFAAPYAEGQTFVPPKFGRPEAVIGVRAAALNESLDSNALTSNENISPIDFATALRLAGTNNLDISRARETVTQSGIQLQRAQMLI